METSQVGSLFDVCTYVCMYVHMYACMYMCMYGAYKICMCGEFWCLQTIYRYVIMYPKIAFINGYSF